MEDKPGFIKYVVMGGVPFGVLFTLLVGFPTYPHNPQALLWTFVSAGLFFGIAIALFARSAKVQKQTSITLPSGETAILSGAANHFMGAEARGGKLYLTNKHLLFQPHNVNVQKTPVELSLSDITKVSKSLTFGIVPNGLLVETVNRSNRFVVNSPSRWQTAIMQQKRST